MNKVTSLKSLLIVRLIIPILLFVFIEATLSYFVTMHFVDKVYDRWLLDSLRSLTQEVKVIDDEVSVNLTDMTLEVFKWDDIDKTFFKIETENKGLLAGDAMVPVPLTLTHLKHPFYSDATINGEAIRMVSMQISGNIPDNVTIHVAETLNKRQNMMRDVLLADIIPQVFLTLLVSICLFKGVNWGLAPLNKLADEIARRSPSDLSPISDAHVFKEVRALTDTINDLLGKLTAAIAAQHRFIANAAHQLRTPLAGLKLQADRAQREDDIQAMQPALAHITSSADRVSHIVSQLLVLARSGPIEGSHQFEIIDLHKLVKTACIHWAPKALKREIELSFEAPDHALFIKGDNILLTELLGNLLDNAVAYGKQQGTIFVKLTDKPGTCLTISDDGPGINKDELDKIFERFYRIPGSPGNGCGLGLAIVKEIAHLHQANIVIGASDSGGTRVDLQFSTMGINLMEV